MSTKSKQKSGAKQRGTFLTILLVIMALHGIVAGFFYYSARMDDSIITRPWLVTLMAIHSFANVIAAVGIWKWKMWAWQLYIASTILALVVGLLTMGVWSAFYMVLPLAIVGWALRTKWNLFT
jgi:hypothetical protein